jgi:hypothetical protein
LPVAGPALAAEPPTVINVQPRTGPAGGGFIVTILGTGFTGAQTVMFGASAAMSFTVHSATEITARAPAGTGTVDVTVTTPGGISATSEADRFTYEAPPPPPQHWYRSGAKLSEGTVVPIVMFGGKVNLGWDALGVGEFNCRGVGGGTIENPTGGGAGVGRTNSLSFYECKAPTCEAEVMREFGVEGRLRTTTQNNPAATQEPAFPGWSDALEESEVNGVFSVREKIGEPFVAFKTPSPPGMIRETIICEIAANQQVRTEVVAEGELNPEIGMAKSGNLNGTTAAKPSTVKFSGRASELMGRTGVLHSEVAGEVINTGGSLKYLGYNEQELITVKP